MALLDAIAFKEQRNAEGNGNPGATSMFMLPMTTTFSPPPRPSNGTKNTLCARCASAICSAKGRPGTPMNLPVLALESVLEPDPDAEAFVGCATEVEDTTALG